MLQTTQISGFGTFETFPFLINSNAGTNSASATTLTWSHTTTSATTCLVVGGFAGDNGTVVTITGITYNGIAMTQVQKTASAAQGMSGLWVLFNPPIGTYDIVLTCGSLASRGVSGSSANFGGATAVNASGKTDATTSNPMTTAITSTRKGLAIGNCCTNIVGTGTLNQTWSSPAGMTSLQINSFNSNSNRKHQNLCYSPVFVDASSTSLTTTSDVAPAGQHQSYMILT